MATRRTYNLSPVSGQTDVWQITGGGGGGLSPSQSRPIKGFQNAMRAVASLIDGPFERFDKEQPTTVRVRADLKELS